MKIMYLIPARAGSKGLPGKNTKLLNGKPLICYSLEFALSISKFEDEICVSTDDDNVINIAERLGLNIPFVRPAHLSTDTASTYDVIIHAINHYKKNGKEFDAILILQPTSPFREKEDFQNLLAIFDEVCDMAVTVKESKENPYFTLFEETKDGFLIKSKIGGFERRQDCPNVYAYNGSMYLIKMESIITQKIHEFKSIRKIVMPVSRSIDIDTMADWVLAEYYSNINQ
jgi:CMP-N,N'-diacetyllegionaminic acid synthase